MCRPRSPCKLGNERSSVLVGYGQRFFHRPEWTLVHRRTEQNTTNLTFLLSICKTHTIGATDIDWAQGAFSVTMPEEVKF